jgi:putative oxidoreductase
MKFVIIIVRVLMGLIFLFSSVVVLFKLVPQPELTGPVKTFNEGIAASGYFMPVLKSIELICALALLAGRFIPLTLVVLFPITFNILLFHAFLAPEGLPVAIFIFAGNLFLAYVYRDRYSPLFSAK